MRKRDVKLITFVQRSTSFIYSKRAQELLLVTCGLRFLFFSGLVAGFLLLWTSIQKGPRSFPLVARGLVFLVVCGLVSGFRLLWALI